VLIEADPQSQADIRRRMALAQFGPGRAQARKHQGEARERRRRAVDRRHAVRRRGMSRAVARPEAQGDLTLFEPEKALKTIAVADAAVKHYGRAWRKTKDPLAREQLLKAIDLKVDTQADYVVWRDSVVVPSREMGKQKKPDGIAEPRSQKASLPDVDPGDKVAHTWRKLLCTPKTKDTPTTIDPEKLALAKEEAEHRGLRSSEFQGKGTERGTAGTGEFERYTPPEYIEATVLGAGKRRMTTVLLFWLSSSRSGWTNKRRSSRNASARCLKANSKRRLPPGTSAMTS
jgi:hypothetical protein